MHGKKAFRCLLGAGLLGLAILVLRTTIGSADEPPAEATAAESRGEVFVGQSRACGFLIGTGSKGWLKRGILPREFLRQALLIAAREELGLIDRDAWLGESLPGEGDCEALDLAVIPGKPSVIEILEGAYPTQAVIARREISWAGDYKALLVKAEELSRTWFVEILQDLELQRGAEKPSSDAPVPEPTEALLGEMTFTSQFRAVRQLHEALDEHGESPALLGGLVRGYTNLGVLTEWYWHPAHKALKARALLYAQRMRAADPDSCWAAWHRAYACTLIGFHQIALADLKAGQELFEAAGTEPTVVRPAWVDSLDALCHYEIDKLEARTDTPAVSELDRFLWYLGVEAAGGRKWMTETGYQVLDELPECYRIYEPLAEFGGLGPAGSGSFSAAEMLAENLYRRLKDMPDLPREARQIIDGGTPGQGLLGKLFGAEPTEEHEYQRRARLIAALLSPGQSPQSDQEAQQRTATEQVATTARDANPMSWATLGLLIRELSYVRVWRSLRYQGPMLGAHTDNPLGELTPLVADHPYRVFLETYSSDAKTRTEALDKLTWIDPEGLEAQAHHIIQNMSQHYDDAAYQFLNVGVMNMDDTVGDMVKAIRMSCDTRSQLSFAYRLIDASPYSPMARALLVKQGSKEFRSKMPEWEKSAGNYPTLARAFGLRYLKDKRYDKAAQFFRTSIAMSPEAWTYRKLAKVYKAQGKMDLWLATLEEALDKPDYDLEHGEIRTVIAHELMEQKEWKKALPYAQAAAQTGAGWAMAAVAYCYEGVQDWENAEAWFRTTSLRYDDCDPGWYFFCRRTGHGDIEAARRRMLERIENAPNVVDEKRFLLAKGLFYVLEGQPEKGLEILFDEIPGNAPSPYHLHIAMVADRLGEPEYRGIALRRATRGVPSGFRLSTDKPQKKLARLAKHLNEDLRREGKAELDLKVLEKLRREAEDAEWTDFSYFLGQYFNLHGKPKLAVKYWKECMSRPDTNEFSRTLAGVELMQRGIKPEHYRDLLQKKAADQDTSADN